ncbi:hypothetical protein CICLE_v100209351mg, partial [Citrus x clementina]|jgi:hypothetical protein
MTIE